MIQQKVNDMGSLTNVGEFGFGAGDVRFHHLTLVDGVANEVPIFVPILPILDRNQNIR